jgi:hypothetical protein
MMGTETVAVVVLGAKVTVWCTPGNRRRRPRFRRGVELHGGHRRRLRQLQREHQRLLALVALPRCDSMLTVGWTMVVWLMVPVLLTDSHLSKLAVLSNT